MNLIDRLEFRSFIKNSQLIKQWESGLMFGTSINSEIIGTFKISR